MQCSEQHTTQSPVHIATASSGAEQGARLISADLDSELAAFHVSENSRRLFYKFLGRYISALRLHN